MRVLIAEDDTVSRRLLQSYLVRWGHEVVAAQNGAEAWELFQGEEFPIIITDWMMPEMDGLELIRHIRACERPGYVYIILLTAKSQKEDLVQGMEAGADDFLTKPFDRDELRVRLREGERIIELERKVAEQQAALVQSEKLASLGQLAAGVAHEINNPIAYVTNNLAVLRQDIPAAMEVLQKYRQGRESLARVEPELAADAARMEAAIDLPYIQENVVRQLDKSLEGLHRVREIVKNLRDFARLDEAEFQEVDLNTALESTMEILRHELKSREIRLETHFQELPRVACHPGKINQVFLNLLANAIHACEPGGLIQVRTFPPGGTPHSGGTPPFDAKTAANGGTPYPTMQERHRTGAPTQAAGEDTPMVAVEIEDNGSGILAEHRPRLFEPFFTTKPVGQGTGLGLSVSYGIIRDHGGAIDVESEPGRGSLFRVRLPLKEALGVRH